MSAIFNYQMAKQTAKGTPATAPAFFFEGVGQGDVTVEPEFGSIKTGDGTVWGSGRDYLAGYKIGGQPTFLVSPQNAGFVGQVMLGGVSTAGASDPYTHTITPASATPYFTIWRNVGDRWIRFDDCKVVDFEFMGQTEGDDIILKVKPTIVGLAKPVFLTSAPTQATKETLAYLWNHAEGAWTVDSALTKAVSGFSIKPARTYSAPSGEGTVPFDIFFGKGDITVGIDLIVTDFTYENKVLFGAASPTNLTAVTGTILTGALDVLFTAQAAPARSIRFQVPVINYNPSNVQVAPDPNGTAWKIALGGIARGAAPVMTMTVKNDRATY